MVRNVFRYAACILACRVQVIPSAPELSAPVSVFHFPELIVQHRTALFFQVSHETRYCHLWRDLHQHMNIAATHLCPHNFDPFPLPQLSQDFSYRFPAVLRCKYDVVFTLPFCVIDYLRRSDSSECPPFVSECSYQTAFGSKGSFSLYFIALRSPQPLALPVVLPYKKGPTGKQPAGPFSPYSFFPCVSLPMKSLI